MLTMSNGGGPFYGALYKGATRSVAESVFVTHLLQEIREKRLDLDGIAETLHTTQGTDIPSKTTRHGLSTPLCITTDARGETLMTDERV